MKITEKQKNCPYCHTPFKKWDDGLWDEATWQIDSYTDIGGKHYELLGMGYVPDADTVANLPAEINYCPKCGRPLGEEGKDED